MTTAQPSPESVAGEPTPVGSQASLRRLDALTGLRWLAAFWVFGYHMQVFGALPAPFDFPVQVGSLGVTFFFVLSGFVLTWSMQTSLPVSTFYVRRFARIWPAHMVALLIAIPVFYTFSSDPEHSWVKVLSIPVLLLSVFLLQGFSREPGILFSGNPAAWTLSCEALFYALHPLLGRLLRRASQRGALIIAGATVVVAFGYRAASIAFAPELSAGVPLPIQQVPVFVVGMAIAWAIASGWRPRIPVWLAWVLFAITIAAITALPNAKLGLISDIAASFAVEFATVVCAILIVAVTTSTLRGRRSWLEHPIMVKLGTWSYAFYLVHATVMYAVLNVIGAQRGPGFSNLVWGAGIFVVALALAAVIHHFVEAPAERSIRGWKNRRDRRALVQSAHEAPQSSGADRAN